MLYEFDDELTIKAQTPSFKCKVILPFEDDDAHEAWRMVLNVYRRFSKGEIELNGSTHKIYLSKTTSVKFIFCEDDPIISFCVDEDDQTWASTNILSASILGNFFNDLESELELE